MRYYIYLDKEFLKNIYSVMDNIDFSIDVLELSEENACSTTNHVNIEPGFENVKDMDSNSYGKDSIKKKNDNQKKINRKRANICYGYSTSQDSKKVRRYINIQDVTDIKCLGFYHNLLEKLSSNNRSDEKIVSENGIIDNYYLNQKRNENLSFDKEDIFKINNSYICFDKSKFNINLNLLSCTNCQVNVIGYVLNTSFKKDYKLLKALAVYIE